MAASLRTVLPLAGVTATSMLALDLVLPALPALQQALGSSVPQAQAVVAVFLAGLALSQLLWGEALNRLGPRRCLQLGVGGLVLTSAGCALAPGTEALLLLRALQGVAAGAATIVAMSVVRATLEDRDMVRGIAAIAAVESMVPAAGPVLGALLLPFVGWRGLFWLLAAVALAVLPWVVRVAPRRLPGVAAGTAAPWGAIAGNRRFVQLALSHALAMGALLMFVASAPQVMVHALGRSSGSSALLQVVGVAGFALTALVSGRIAARHGNPRAVRWGALAQVAVCALLLAAGWHAAPPFALLAALWCGYCAALAVRGPAAFADALALPPALLGRASALMVLALLAAGALATQAVAPFIAGASLRPLAGAMLAMALASLALAWRYPPPAVKPA